MELRQQDLVRGEAVPMVVRVVQELGEAMIGGRTPRGWGRETIACRQGDVLEYYESENRDLQLL